MYTDIPTRSEIVSQTLQEKRQIPIKAAKVIRGGSRESAETVLSNFKTLVYSQKEAQSIHTVYHCSNLVKSGVLQPGWRYNELRNA